MQIFKNQEKIALVLFLCIPYLFILFWILQINRWKELFLINIIKSLWFFLNFFKEILFFSGFFNRFNNGIATINSINLWNRWKGYDVPTTKKIFSSISFKSTPCLFIYFYWFYYIHWVFHCLYICFLVCNFFFLKKSSEVQQNIFNWILQFLLTLNWRKKEIFFLDVFVAQSLNLLQSLFIWYSLHSLNFIINLKTKKHNWDEPMKLVWIVLIVKLIIDFFCCYHVIVNRSILGFMV